MYEFFKDKGFKIIRINIEYIICNFSGCDVNNYCLIFLQGEVIHMCDRFKYLGSII